MIIYIQICVILTHPELVTELVQDTFVETTHSDVVPGASLCALTRRVRGNPVWGPR